MPPERLRPCGRPVPHRLPLPFGDKGLHAGVRGPKDAVLLDEDDRSIPPLCNLHYLTGNTDNDGNNFVGGSPISPPGSESERAAHLGGQNVEVPRATSHRGPESLKATSIWMLPPHPEASRVWARRAVRSASSAQRGQRGRSLRWSPLGFAYCKGAQTGPPPQSMVEAVPVARHATQLARVSAPPGPHPEKRVALGELCLLLRVPATSASPRDPMSRRLWWGGAQGGYPRSPGGRVHSSRRAQHDPQEMIPNLNMQAEDSQHSRNVPCDVYLSGRAHHR